MKLVESNKQLNRKFHEMTPGEQVKYLLKAYSQVFAKTKKQRGKFTPAELASLGKKGGREKLQPSIDNLNFLMTRFNMLNNPQYEEYVRTLALLRFEYIFFKGESENTQDPKLVADFFKRRGKSELIRPVLERMGGTAVNYDFLAEKIIDSPVFLENVGKDTQEYKFRNRLHGLIHDEDFSKEQTAAALMDEGFDLLELDFNKWYAFDKDYNLSSGRNKYKKSEKDSQWLRSFVERKKSGLESKMDSPDVPKADDEEGDSDEEYKGSKTEIQQLDKQVKKALTNRKEYNFYLVNQLSVLTSDYEKIDIDSSNKVQAKMWDYLWGGKFNDLIHQLKGANPHGRTRKGLNYNKWALLHPEHRKNINQVLAQDSYAMIIAGDILVGDLEQAVEDFNMPELQEYKNHDKLRATLSLAWEMMHHPGESDDREDYEPLRGYLFNVAKEFSEFLGEMPSAKTYLNLANATKETRLGDEEEKILKSMRNLQSIQKIYTQIGRDVKERFLDVFDEVYVQDSEFCSLTSELRGIVSLVQDPIFRKYVDDKATADRLAIAIDKTLGRKNKSFPEEDKHGTKKMVAAMYNNPVLRPYVEGKIDIGKMVNGMIDDIIDRKNPETLITKPFSLRGQHEITMGISDTLEAYNIADACRDKVNPERMKDLVAYMIGIVSDGRMNNDFELSNLVISMKAKEEGNENVKKIEADKDEKSRFKFLSEIYLKEKELGGLDRERASIALTNVLFRSNYAVTRRYYPHIDTMLSFLDSPLVELLPTEGLGHDAIKEYKILHEFMRK